MSVWINGRKSTRLDYRDRGLQYGDGVFETMHVQRGAIRLVEYHLDRLYAGCRRLRIAAPTRAVLRRELEARARLRRNATLKLILTRGSGRRGYRPTGRERCTRIVTLDSAAGAAQRHPTEAVRVRLCLTPIGANPRLAGLKTLNRLESIMARSEWSNPRIWEGLMSDADDNIVCGTMSNLFLKSGRTLVTPLLDRCGVAGVMRRWVMETAGAIDLRLQERRVLWKDLARAEEVFMSNAIVGLRSVAVIERGRERLRDFRFDIADELRRRLALL